MKFVRSLFNFMILSQKSNSRLSTWRWLLLLPFALLLGCDSKSNANQTADQVAEPVVEAKQTSELVVYSSRKEHLIKPLFDRYESETGTKIRYITDNAGALLARLKAEGELSPADVLLTVDAGNLWHAAQAQLLQPVDSTILKGNIPAHLRDEADRWFGLSLRARTIVYSTERVSPKDLSTYSALASPAFEGKLCLRTSKKVYNQSLVAAMIHRLGPQVTEQTVTGWVNNLAVDVFSSDTRLIEAIASGACDVGVVNTYYLGRLQRDNPDYPVAVFWPNQSDSGVHVNVSGAGVTKHSQRAEAAQQLLEWLSSAAIQSEFAALNLEFPVSQAVAPHPLIASWGAFKSDQIPVEKLGELQSDAVKLMDRVGYR